MIDPSQSEETLYRKAVDKRGSSSLEDGLDLSDESNLLGNLILGEKGSQDDVQPSTSRPVVELTMEEQVANRIPLGEKVKASMFPPKGEENLNNLYIEGVTTFKSIKKMDQDYMIVGAHIDERTREKISQGLYVDFSKLLPKDRILVEEDGQMELVICNGKTFWMPASATEGVNINTFNKWEQAFRVHCVIYTKKFPGRVSELIQYNHIIHSISMSYTWENVYTYDKDFRLHLAAHPSRSWAIILQQAWLLRLRLAWQETPTSNKYHYNGGHNSGSQSGNGHGNGSGFKGKLGEICKRFNKGKCSLGHECNYEHRCSYCYKFGHGVIVCHKLNFDQDHKKQAKKEDYAGK